MWALGCLDILNMQIKRNNIKHEWHKPAPSFGINKWLTPFTFIYFHTICINVVPKASMCPLNIQYISTRMSTPWVHLYFCAIYNMITPIPLSPSYIVWSDQYILQVTLSNDLIWDNFALDDLNIHTKEVRITGKSVYATTNNGFREIMIYGIASTCKWLCAVACLFR